MYMYINSDFFPRLMKLEAFGLFPIWWKIVIVLGFKGIQHATETHFELKIIWIGEWNLSGVQNKVTVG